MDRGDYRISRSARAHTPLIGPTLRRIAEKKPRAIALMHGPTFIGDGALNSFAAYFETALKQAITS